MNIYDEFKQIEEKYRILIQKATSLMKIVPDPKHSLSHMYSVVNYTKEILIKTKADKEVCIISAYWHDVGRTIQQKGHAKLSAEMLKTEMQNLGYDDEFVEKCYNAVCKHGWNEQPETLEGIIIRDADKIDFVGIGRWSQCIENDCKFTKILDLLPTMRKELLKLDCSKEIFDREIGKLVVFLHNKIFNLE